MKDISIKELKNTATQMRMKVIDMIYKEEKVLIPETMSFFTKSDWQQMADEIAGNVSKVYVPSEPSAVYTSPAGLILRQRIKKKDPPRVPLPPYAG